MPIDYKFRDYNLRNQLPCCLNKSFPSQEFQLHFLQLNTTKFFWILTSSVSLSPLRSRHQDKIKHVGDVLREIPMEDKGESEKQQAGDTFRSQRNKGGLSRKSLRLQSRSEIARPGRWETPEKKLPIKEAHIGQEGPSSHTHSMLSHWLGAALQDHELVVSECCSGSQRCSSWSLVLLEGNLSRALFHSCHTSFTWNLEMFLAMNDLEQFIVKGKADSGTQASSLKGQ